MTQRVLICNFQYYIVYGIHSHFESLVGAPQKESY